MDIITTGAALTVANKLLGKTAEAISSDIAKLYNVGKEKIFSVAIRKTPNTDDGKQTNLRVTRDVFWNGSYTDESICAEYFGGILASSRSVDGKDDRGIYYADIIKSLSSQQLLLHYYVYTSLNKLWFSMPAEKESPNPGLMSELQNYNLWLATEELSSLGVSVEKDLIALMSKGLITASYEAQALDLEDDRKLFYTKVQPCTLGVQLYAVAHNKLEEWATVPSTDFGEFPDIKMIQYFAFSSEELKTKLNLK